MISSDQLVILLLTLGLFIASIVDFGDPEWDDMIVTFEFFFDEVQ